VSGRGARVGHLLHRGAELVSAALFAAMFGAFMVQVFTRYVLNDPVVWTLELCSLAYVWGVCFTAGALVREREHIAFDLIYQHVRPGLRRWLAIANTGLIALLFLAGLPGTVDFIVFMGRIRTLDLRIPFDIVFSCFILFLVLTVLFGLVRLRRLLGPDWRTEP
jgi:TRAP-type C4-dicarboxylate transport system permease small subunit